MSPTQRERRESTIARLLDASIATIAELGYARASAHRITKRAGLSYGALFRHFPTMGDFMAATATEVLRRQLAATQERFARDGDPVTTIEDAIEILRDVTSSPTNAVLYELMIAARTDEQLGDTLRKAVAEYGDKIIELAREMPASGDWPDEEFVTLVFTLTDMCDGEAIVRTLRPYPELTEKRGELLRKLLEGYRPGTR